MKRIVSVLTLILVLLLSSSNISFADVKEVGKDVPTGSVINARGDGFTYLYVDDTDLDQQVIVELKNVKMFEIKGTNMLLNRGTTEYGPTFEFEMGFHGIPNHAITISIKNSSNSSEDVWSAPEALQTNNTHVKASNKDCYSTPQGTKSKSYYLDIKLFGSLRDFKEILGDFNSIWIRVTDSSLVEAPCFLKLEDNYSQQLCINIYKIIGQSYEDVGYFVETVDYTNIESNKEYPVYGKNIIMYEVGDPHNTGRGLESYKCKYNSSDKYILDHTIWMSWGYGYEFLVDNITINANWDENTGRIKKYVINQVDVDNIKIIDLFRLDTLWANSSIIYNLKFDQTDNIGIQAVSSSLQKLRN